VCANRISVQDGVYDAFTKRLAETAGAMKVADGCKRSVSGPAQAAARVASRGCQFQGRSSVMRRAG
jgi:succinate-semialdehyde dehydrogenase/glutarate-semialdehyde dehydrogenase